MQQWLKEIMPHNVICKRHCFILNNSNNNFCTYLDMYCKGSIKDICLPFQVLTVIQSKFTHPSSAFSYSPSLYYLRYSPHFISLFVSKCRNSYVTRLLEHRWSSEHPNVKWGKWASAWNRTEWLELT